MTCTVNVFKRTRQVQRQISPSTRLRDLIQNTAPRGRGREHINHYPPTHFHSLPRFDAMHILIADSDPTSSDQLALALREHGYAVDVVQAGDAADAALAAQGFDLLILDMGLPRMNSLDVLRRLRSRGTPMPVLMLNIADNVESRVRCLDLGADDYLAKPYAMPELTARVRALTRRAAGSFQNLLRHGPLTLDIAGHVAALNNEPLDLSARELGLLEVLMQRAGRLVSKAQVVDHLCEWGEEVSNNAIEVYVHRLRKKLETGGIHITTVRGLGYCLQRLASGGNVPAALSTAEAKPIFGSDTNPHSAETAR